MRPRHYCRGRVIGQPMVSIVLCGFNEAAALLPRKGRDVMQIVGRHEPASMRPRHYCRGRSMPSLRSIARPTCFNEAAALLPRKGHHVERGGPPTFRFNEAAALLPRKDAFTTSHNPKHLPLQ